LAYHHSFDGKFPAESKQTIKGWTAVVRQKSKRPIKALISNLLKAVDRVSMRL
jgi:hypothetical protein